MPADPLLSIAEELYCLTPAEFTGTRNQWARQTRAEGDRELAQRVTALRRPSTAAWVVNMLMRHQGEQMTQVLDLGASLRRAQQDLDGEALRELNRQRRRLTSAVTQQGRELARDLGQKVTESVAAQVEDTLHAAMVDESAADAVRSGMLVAALTATGVGQADVVDALAVPSALGLTPRARTRPAAKRAGLHAVPDGGGGQPAEEAAEEAEADAELRQREAERRERQQAFEEARAAADQAKGRLRKARKRVSRLEARTLQVADELDQARRRAAELEHELEVLDEESAQAQARRGRAEERYARAQDALAAAQEVLDQG